MSTSSGGGQNIHMIQYKFDSTGTELEQTHEWKIDRSKGEKYRKDYLNRLRKMGTYKSVYTKPVTKKEVSAQKGINIVKSKTATTLAQLVLEKLKGTTLVFDKNGLVDEYSEIFTVKPEKDGTVLGRVFAPVRFGWFFILVVPAGAEAPEVNYGNGTKSTGPIR